MAVRAGGRRKRGQNAYLLHRYRKRHFTGDFENDTIYAGTGLGTFTAGSGSDSFVFIADNLPNHPTINNCQVSSKDVVVYDIHTPNEFDLGPTDNAMDPAMPTLIDPSIFIANATGDFTSSSQRFAYDTTNGNLFYSATGSNASETTFATFTNEPSITAGNLRFQF